MKKLLILMGILAAFGVPWASATVEVRIIDVVGGVAVGDTGWITSSGAIVSFSGAVGNYDIATDTAVQHTSSNPILDMNYSASTINSSNPGTIIIEAMADGYLQSTPEFQLIDNGNSGFNPGTYTDAAYGGNNNNICPAGTSACWDGVSNPAPTGTGSALIAAGGPFVGNTTWAVNAYGPGNTTTPYSVGLIVTLANPTGMSTMSGDIKLDAVPEPASIMLLGGILLFTGSRLRRRVK